MVDNFTIHHRLRILHVAFIHTEPDIGPIIVPSFVLSVPVRDVGGPTTINISATAGAAPCHPDHRRPAAPGIRKLSHQPVRLLQHHAHPGSATSAATSGLERCVDAASGVSGCNVGALRIGLLANVGATISGIYNTGPLNLQDTRRLRPRKHRPACCRAAPATILDG